MKGHQEGPTIPLEVTLNNRADELAAKAFKAISKSVQQEHHQYPAAGIHVTINNQLITRAVKRKLQEEYTSRLIHNNMQNCLSGIKIS
eukprot:2747299-Ditylum_brightwellii.AAC.1